MSVVTHLHNFIADIVKEIKLSLTAGNDSDAKLKYSVSFTTSNNNEICIHVWPTDTREFRTAAINFKQILDDSVYKIQFSPSLLVVQGSLCDDNDIPVDIIIKFYFDSMNNLTSMGVIDCDVPDNDNSEGF